MIDLVDNQRSEELSKSEIEDFLPLANKDIRKLCEENKRLLVFPHSLDMSNDKIEYNPLFVVDDYKKEYLKVKTGNIMGFIGSNGKRMRIRSRFDRNGDNDFFLHYMLQKVLSINLFDLNHGSSQDDVLDLLELLFPSFLHKALEQGIYREYKRYEHNDANIRGVIAVSRHIRQNIPFQGKVAYNTREHTTNNNVMQLIRHTIEHIKRRQFGSSLLTDCKEVADDVKLVYSLTSSYNRNERQRVILKNLRPVIHPYYTDYRPLQQLCLQILRHDSVMYADNDNEICGLLFDGAWLWEEYVYTLLKEQGFKHPNNKKREGGKCIFTNNKGIRYPDFYDKNIVLDAKYKRFEDYSDAAGVGRDDIHQLVTYMYMLKSKKSGFIFPYTNGSNNQSPLELNGYGGWMYMYGIEIGNNTNDYRIFCEDMKKAENVFIGRINKE
ncbi:hypothetical protein CIK99_06230 [Prevotella sp. P5-92]|uniref:McrC family protein n=1 Tax=Prevotella sp. P5-92 TaxID=2024222 RepID=UPI000B95F877|nr:hypothetical protein [Prevotella sp. P5-92]OYP57696.1 hypothetical protein CIK99_06230 [Prevotella sp. P5-92]